MNHHSERAPIYTCAEWTFPLIERITGEIQRIADEELQIDYYPYQIEIVTSEQMLDAYTSVGMPVGYAHWSFGKHFVTHDRKYQRGGGLAYELVINSDPSIVYCVENNSMTMQALVIAHAAIGHNAFFANNYLFKQWTRPKEIINYLLFAQRYIAKCEERYGVKNVELVLDACHALKLYGVDKYTHPQELSTEEEEKRQDERAEYLQQHLNVLWNSALYRKDDLLLNEEEKPFPSEPKENILAFVEKNAPELPIWKREIIRIVRNIGQYFSPQMQTKLMNEGFACFVHYYILGRLYEKGLITDGAYQEFLVMHTGTCHQPEPQAGKYVPVINPYALGFKMFMDIKRICDKPTREDKEWFPDISGSDWLETIKFAYENFKDESFVRQFLSPHLVEDMGLFVVVDDSQEEYIEVTAIQDDSGFVEVRSALADSYDLGLNLPNIEVVRVDKRGDRTLTVRHTEINDMNLESLETELTLQHLQYLWEFPVDLEVLRTYTCEVELRVETDGLTIMHPYSIENDDDRGESLIIIP